jgi:hypothetical protein
MYFTSEIYRVRFKNGGVGVYKIDRLMGSPHSVQETEQLYDSPSDLPKWVQDKVALLSMFDPNEKPAQTVEGIGRRVDENTFWVYK